MNSNRLFANTRWRLARWYAGIFSLIVSIFGLGVYEAIVHAHKITINQELETVGGTIHDSLEPILEKPEQLNLKQIANIFPDICFVSNQYTRNRHRDGHFIGAIAQGQYYLQFFDLSGELVAIAGMQPKGLLNSELRTQNSEQTRADAVWLEKIRVFFFDSNLKTFFIKNNGKILKIRMVFVIDKYH